MLVLTCCDEIRSMTVKIAANQSVPVSPIELVFIDASLRALEFCAETEVNSVSTKLIRGFGHQRSLLLWGRMTIAAPEMNDLLNTMRTWPDRCVNMSVDGGPFRAFANGSGKSRFQVPASSVVSCLTSIITKDLTNA